MPHEIDNRQIRALRAPGNNIYIVVPAGDNMDYWRYIGYRTTHNTVIIAGRPSETLDRTWHTNYTRVPRDEERAILAAFDAATLAHHCQ